MSDIEWTDRTWNPVRGCSIVSAGCKNCYAMKQAHRFSAPGKPYAGLTQLSKNGPVWTGKARFIPEMLAKPLGWKAPQKIFVNSMSDLFHDDITSEQIAAVFGVMAACPQHTFQVLTKRPERMRAWVTGQGIAALDRGACFADDALAPFMSRDARARAFGPGRGAKSWPLPNVWLGVSAENQKTADERIPILRQIPAAVRFVSVEPLLERVDLRAHLKATLVTRDGERFQHPDPRACSSGGTWEYGIGWVIVGGESGPGARPCAIEWIDDVMEQCRSFGTRCFVKQMGAVVVSEERMVDGEWAWRAGLTDRHGADVEQFPGHLVVRQFPKRTGGEA